MMMSNSQEETQVKKIIPSKLETGFQQLLYKTIGKIIPKKMTPNQMTTVGVISALIGIICAGLSRVSPLFLIGTICGITGHLIADDLDGYIARTRGMSSKAGAYFDLLTDILHNTYLHL
jgi:phosphatidylglycerophosphate synthase